jgi:hypothetical protein
MTHYELLEVLSGRYLAETRNVEARLSFGWNSDTSYYWSATRILSPYPLFTSEIETPFL